MDWDGLGFSLQPPGKQMKSIFVTGGNLWVVRRLFWLPFQQLLRLPTLLKAPWQSQLSSVGPGCAYREKAPFRGWIVPWENKMITIRNLGIPNPDGLPVIVIVMAEILHKCTKSCKWRWMRNYHQAVDLWTIYEELPPSSGPSTGSQKNLGRYVSPSQSMSHKGYIQLTIRPLWACQRSLVGLKDG